MDVEDQFVEADCGCRLSRLVSKEPGTLFKIKSCRLGPTCPNFELARLWLEAQKQPNERLTTILINPN